ncbi:MAG: type II toxin-antitoxin system VapC family toxin [Desulfobacteraceae bacterium]|nr:MAG: type II toxin-antitoxin system VapC family toxin [Desulfobacteraceae bacterium]
MNAILDTHAFIWSFLDPDRLGQKLYDIIRKKENRIYVSVVTFWEVSLKYALGKLSLTNVLPEQMPDLAAQMDFEILPLSAAEAATFYRLPKRGHKDPFDRLIIWQAIQNKLPLISKDEGFKGYRTSGLKLVW